LNVLKVAFLAVIFSIGAGLAHADGIDGRVNVNGGGPGSPPCGIVSLIADGMGDFTGDCTAQVNVTIITFAVPFSQTNNQGLSCLSQLTSIGWTETNSLVNGVASCTFTAPTAPSTTFGDDDEENDCDLDDFATGIPAGCDVKLTTVTGFPFDSGATGTLSVNGAVPEPASLGLLAMGIGVLFFGKRRSSGLQIQ